MKVFHIPFCYHPDPVGGTEVYVSALINELKEAGIEGSVAIPDKIEKHDLHDGISVFRFSGPRSECTLRELYGEGAPWAGAAFSKLLIRERPDIVHFHSFTSQSLRLIQAAKACGIPVVFTYHTPAVSCQRGTMMCWGTTPCDGALNHHRCARCALHGRGASKTMASIIGSLPGGLGAVLGRIGFKGGVWTALRFPELMGVRHRVLHAVFEEADHLVAVCDWVYGVLLRNGVAKTKLTLCRQGVPTSARLANPHPATVPPLRVVFLGRLDAGKGLDILIQAIRSLPDAPVCLDIYGIQQDSGPLRASLERLAGNDRRITFLPPVAASEVTTILGAYHLLAVPSQLMETGPLVILEAFAAGIPVVGSRLGGIEELLVHGKNGILVDAASVPQWASVLRALCEDNALLHRLRSGITAPRTMKQAALEMAAVYRRVLGDRRNLENKTPLQRALHAHP